MDKENIQQETCENCDVSTECEAKQDEQKEENTCSQSTQSFSEQQNEADDTAVNEGDDETVEELKKKLSDAKQKCDDYLAMAQRIQADFENYKRRNKTAVSDAYRDGVIEAVRALLPVLDNLERALENAKNSVSDEGKAISKGIEMVVKQFIDIMSKMDIEEIEALGKPFDPNYHDAVMQVEAENEEQRNTVVEVLQKGYKQKDKVIRYSMVKVAN